MGKAPAFQFYAADFLMGTNDLTTEEVGAYIRMLASSWDKGPLPTDEARLARICGLEMRAFRAAWKTLSEKWVLTDDGYINERMEAQRMEYQSFIERQIVKGQKGAKARWDNGTGHAPAMAPAMPRPLPRHSPGNAQAMPSDSSSVFSLHTSTSEEKKDTHTHGEPLVNGREIRLHGQHAWCSWPKRDGLCVPAFLHREFVGKLGAETADACLKIWYPDVVAQFEGQPVGDDGLRFWRNQFAAWVGTVTVAPQSGRKSAAQVTIATMRSAG